MNVRNKFLILFIMAVAIGIFIGCVDSSPNWDDTGVTVIALSGVTALFGFLYPKRAWMFALAVGIWIPIFNFILHGTFSSAPAILIAFIGAYAGALFHKMI